LFGATFSTEILGTPIAVYGILVTPIGWKYALWIWARLGVVRLQRWGEDGGIPVFVAADE